MSSLPPAKTRSGSKPASSAPKPKFFATPANFRAWLEEHHATEMELLVGFYKRDSGKPSITWPESVDAALCYGWIDGVRRKLDDESYSIRFTPRKGRSTWSAINIKRVGELTRQQLMRPAGIKAFEARLESRSAIYAFEQREVAFDAAQEAHFRANKGAWTYFQSKPPWYRRTATWWVVSAKRQETRDKRLGILIECSERKESIPQLARNA
ncbi:MAG: YdeI/OmpD-associated family protein [Acidobacteriaceae bacterium]|nr:YdeI/OmpD-associated family protein [Acidobacteriaceae bacterium]